MFFFFGMIWKSDTFFKGEKRMKKHIWGIFGLLLCVLVLVAPRFSHAQKNRFPTSCKEIASYFGCGPADENFGKWKRYWSGLQPELKTAFAWQTVDC